MSTITKYQDSNHTITITSSTPITTTDQSVQQLDLYLNQLNVSLPLVSVRVTATAVIGEYLYKITAVSTDILQSKIMKIAGNWNVETLNSSYFPLAILLINNNVRNMIQNIIDAGATQVIITYP